MQAPVIINPEYNEEEDAPRDNIAPSGDVFSYFLLTTPKERKNNNGRFTVDAFTSYLLVFIVLFMQSVMLYCVWNKVIGKNLSWQNGIMNTGNYWNVAQPAAKCNDGKSLCVQDKHGNFTCAPPSVQLIGRWDQLDVNGDGIWTQEEVMSMREELKCEYAVDPVEVFNVLGYMLQKREEFIWIHPDVKSGKAIHKMYFTYIMGDVAMCLYRNRDMCGNLVKRGFFDAAIISGNVPRVGKTIRSALDYCYSMLEHGGICDRSLPSAYDAWKVESVEECRKPDFDEFTYQDPKTGAPKSLLAVDYKGRKSYEVAQTSVFIVYKTCIVLIWMLLIVAQVRDAMKTITWVLQIPTTQSAATTSKEDPIHAISETHEWALLIVSGVRIATVIVLLWIGLNFLARQTDYIGLLMDGVALIFIVEVEEIIYARVVRQDVRSDWEGSKEIPLKKVGLFAGRPDVVDLMWFFFLTIAATVFMMIYTQFSVKPLYSALKCACLSEGDACIEAQKFNYDFWQQYWLEDVPGSIQQIGRLKMQDHFSLIETDAAAPVSSHVARAAGNLLKRGLSLRP